jgi:HAD superfamily hydrolase (TIGR01549 family)
MNTTEITHIYFDWASTLAYSKMRNIFLYSKTIEDKLSVLYQDTDYILKYLTSKGYILGIISNTSKDKNTFLESLAETKLLNYFKGAIILSNGQYKKPCKEIFNDALTIDCITPEKAVMVGNNYYKDIVGAFNVNMFTVYIEREKIIHEPLYNVKIDELNELIHYF